MGKDIMDKYKQAEGAVLQGKAQVYEHVATARQFLNTQAGTIIVRVEKQFPDYAGVIPKTAGDLLLSTLYLLFVAYVVFRIARFVIGVALSIFCCFCCCRCCCRKRKEATTNGGKNGKNGKHQDSKAAAKGKATPQPKANASKTKGK